MFQGGERGSKPCWQGSIPWLVAKPNLRIGEVVGLKFPIRGS